MVLLLLASCGAPAQPVVSASHTTGPAPQKTTTVEIARAAEVHFSMTGIAFYGAMIQTHDGFDDHGRPLHPTPRDTAFAPGSTVSIASAACTIERLTGKPNRTVCAAHASHAEADADEARFLARVNACFHVAPIALSAPALRTLEASTTTRPESSAPFVTVAITSRTTELVPVAPYVYDGCKNVGHPCDPGPRHIVDVTPVDPSKAIAHVVERHDFAAYGPQGYTFATQGGPYPLTGTALLYAAPMLVGDRPDARFVVQRYAYPPNAWEPPPSVSVDASRETLSRLAALAIDHENETVQLALVLDRALLAYAIGDDAAGKRYVTELDAWTATHPRAFATATQLDMSHTVETLRTLASGGFSVKDPCAK